MLVGYARTSTVDQVAGLEAQERDLRAAGCEKVFAEQVSSVAASRPQLAAALEFVREGDTFVVAKLDRLARSVADVLAIEARLKAKRVALRVLNLGMDTGTPTGRLVLTTLGAIAEFERAIMLERQREGVAKAKKDGKFKGRKPTVAAQAGAMRRLRGEGVGHAEIARRLGVARSSVYRVLGATEKAPASRPIPVKVTHETKNIPVPYTVLDEPPPPPRKIRIGVMNETRLIPVVSYPQPDEPLPRKTTLTRRGG